MFDANIQYYCYKNEADDDFGVGYLGNKEFWTDLINIWQRNDGNKHRYIVEEFEELSPIADMRGCLLAEIVPDGKDFVVSWVDEDNEFSLKIKHGNETVWENNPKENVSIPRWINRLKNQLRNQS
jgi:hypothetical protein